MTPTWWAVPRHCSTTDPWACVGRSSQPVLGPSAVEGVLRSSLVIVFSLTFLEGSACLGSWASVSGHKSALTPYAADGGTGVWAGTSLLLWHPN